MSRWRPGSFLPPLGLALVNFEAAGATGSSCVPSVLSKSPSSTSKKLLPRRLLFFLPHKRLRIELEYWTRFGIPTTETIELKRMMPLRFRLVASLAPSLLLVVRSLLLPSFKYCCESGGRGAAWKSCCCWVEAVAVLESSESLRGTSNKPNRLNNKARS